uniref:Uncharacterized protein n=1 Tax=Opuntia streptacantha TaxID=393608 RepID=A0A7C8ZQH5_OPUST
MKNSAYHNSTNRQNSLLFVIPFLLQRNFTTRKLQSCLWRIYRWNRRRQHKAVSRFKKICHHCKFSLPCLDIMNSRKQQIANTKYALNKRILTSNVVINGEKLREEPNLRIRNVASDIVLE